MGLTDPPCGSWRVRRDLRRGRGEGGKAAVTAGRGDCVCGYRTWGRMGWRSRGKEVWVGKSVGRELAHEPKR